MKKMTQENLKSTFSGESQAHMRYLIFAGIADREKNPNLARLFRAIAFAELVHAKNHYQVLGGIGPSTENLQTSIDGETFEVEEMYPAYKAVAELQDEKEAQRTTYWALQAEKIHAAMYQKAKQAIDQGKDVELGDVLICEFCGYTVEGKAPDKCPICGASKDKFRKF
ncbi:MAG: rubrerythrin [candidate division Zixibacteria bacterium SM23_73_2]|nr:MAG: rubrerythrin [candidate division Zixibacteria bacterium SM23_73_2]